MNVICSIKNISISLFLSIEAGVLLLGQLFRNRMRFGIFEEIGAFLFSSNDIVTSITIVVPVTLLGIAFGIQKDLLKPKEVNKKFYQSPQYLEFKQTTFIGIIYTALPVLPAFISIIRKDYYDVNDLGYYYLLLLLVSIISTSSMYLAKFKLNELLDVFLSDNSK